MLPESLKPKAADIIEIQAYDDAGNLVHDLRGKHLDFRMPTGVRERDGQVWLSSIGTTHLATFPTPRADPKTPKPTGEERTPRQG